MTPTPHYEEGIPEDIIKAVEVVGNRLIKRYTADIDGEGRGWRELDGHCHDTAYTLAEELLSRGYEPHLVWGAVAKTSGHNLRIDTIDQLEATSRVHFWVEIAPHSIGESDSAPEDAEPIVVELSSETIRHVNCPIVATKRPARYRLMGQDPSHLRFERSYEVEDLVSEESYRRLRARSPELFSCPSWADFDSMDTPVASATDQSTPQQ